ncbi:glycoside hydrolase family 28 protein [Peniophora sp. CONT]|nr:glycoside hydrolase family 28 protein [Peniophora sp. CONT]
MMLRNALVPFATALVVAQGVFAQAGCTLSASGDDDGPAFAAAVRSCDTTVIPKGTTLSVGSALNLTGLTNKHISLEGTIKFTDDISYWISNAFFITYQNQSTFWYLGGENVLLDGGGTLDGSGQAWYDKFASNSSLVRPILLTVFGSKNLTVKDVTLLNSPEWVNLVWQSSDVVYDNVNISARSTSSKDAKNTDGWDIYQSDSITIQNSVIVNGDDCVSFKPNTTNVLVSNLSCTGSHGISVGSLGQYPGMFDIVKNVTARNISMSNAQNGARIKAWAGPNVGSGIVQNITFEYFTESDVDNPVVIDQCYMTDADACAANPSNTYIQDVWFNHISGTSSGKTVASLSCSPGARCTDVNVNDLDLSPPSGTATYSCSNVELTGDAASLFGTCKTT